MEQCGRSPQQAFTTMFFLIPRNVTNEYLIALLPTLIGWLEWLRPLQVSRWQERHRVGWDATDERHGGAERTAWEELIYMERVFVFGAGETDQGWIALVLEVATAFERVSLTRCVRHGQRTSTFPGGVSGCCVVTSSTKWRVQFEGCVAESLQTITAFFLGSKWGSLLLRSVLRVNTTPNPRKCCTPAYVIFLVWLKT